MFGDLRLIEGQEEAAKEAAKPIEVPETKPVQPEEPEVTRKEEEIPQYDRDVVIQRLRLAGLVVTFFGESDWEREQRWLQHDTSSKEDFSYNKGMKNDFDDMLRNLNPDTTEDDALNSMKDLREHEAYLKTPIEKIFDGLTLCDEDKVLLILRVGHLKHAEDDS